MEKPLPLLLVFADKSPVEIKKWGSRPYLLTGWGELGVHLWGKRDWERSCFSTEPGQVTGSSYTLYTVRRSPGKCCQAWPRGEVHWVSLISFWLWQQEYHLPTTQNKTQGDLN